jgi:hypothetical protein
MNTDQYPSSKELRTWAQSKRAGAGVGDLGALPNCVVLAWNRAHPERPYVRSQSHHGTWNGYSTKSCRCERCLEAGRAYSNGLKRLNREETTNELADALLDQS